MLMHITCFLKERKWAGSICSYIFIREHEEKRIKETVKPFFKAKSSVMCTWSKAFDCLTSKTALSENH